MKKIRWGVIGSGGIARRRTIPEGIVAADNAELAVVYDISDKVNTEVAAEFKVEAAKSVEDLLSRDIDAVYIATPVVAHLEQSLAAAEAGRHVLCEKPLGLTVADADRIIRAFEDKGLQLGSGFMMRFHAQHQAALKLIEDGKLGQMVYGRAQLSCWFPPMEGAWRQDPEKGGGGSLIDMGGHCIDLLEMFFGPVVRVACSIRNSVHDYKSEDSAAVLLDFASGAMGTVDTFFCIPDTASKNALELYGSKGSILATNTIGQGEIGDMHAYVEEEVGGYQADQKRAEGGGMEIRPEPVNMYRSEIEAFSRALIEGGSPENHAGQARRSQLVLTACYESARTGRFIEIDA